MFVRLERLAAPDMRESEVDEQRFFTFDGVPSESVSIEFHSPGETLVRGYRLSPSNVVRDARRAPSDASTKTWS